MQDTSPYGIVHDMWDTIDIVQQTNNSHVIDLMKYIDQKSGIVLTGEWSSRIFPAKMMIYQAIKYGYHKPIISQG